MHWRGPPTDKRARRESERPLQVSRRQRCRRSSRTCIATLDYFSSDDDEDEVAFQRGGLCFDVTEYPDEEYAPATPATQASEPGAIAPTPTAGDGGDSLEEDDDDDDDSEGTSDDDSECPRAWPVLERSSSGGDEQVDMRLSDVLLSRSAERRSRGERLSNASGATAGEAGALDELEEVQLFAPEALDAGFTLPLQRDERSFGGRSPLGAWAAPRVRADASNQVTLDELLARRHVAGALLTGRRGRTAAAASSSASASASLPALPDEIAALVLRAALPLDAALSPLQLCSGVGIDEALASASLRLCGCEMGPDAAEVVAWVLRHNSNLTALDASANPLGGHGAACLGRALPCATRLASLALDGCELVGTDGAGLDAMLSLGVAGHPSLRSLSLSSNGVGCNGGLGVRGLVAALSHPETKLEALDLSANALQPHGCAAIAGVLLAAASTAPTPPTLRRLDLSANQLTGGWGKCLDGVRALAMALACNTTLEDLALRSNALGSAHLSTGSAALWLSAPTSATPLLARALTYNASLRHLDLRANHVVGSQEEQLRAVWGAGSGAGSGGGSPACGAGARPARGALLL